ncbi:hypothetical protein [Thalassospira alkalitolerans]|uniref:hypothetical protein n=1 Tax=Thalassospira alkalitolerans TaxID=1293890 RepID=UPI003AA96332
MEVQVWFDVKIHSPSNDGSIATVEESEKVNCYNFSYDDGKLSFFEAPPQGGPARLKKVIKNYNRFEILTHR